MCNPWVPGGSREPVTATRTPSGVSIRVATPTCVPLLSLRVASADSGPLSDGTLAHPASIAATPTSRSGLTVECLRSVELRDELLGLLPEPRDVVDLDLLVASYFVRQLRDGHRRVVGHRAEPHQHRLDQLAVLADEGPLEATHLRVAEDVEGGAP